MKLFIYSLALALFMESACFALFPSLVRKWMLEVLALPDSGLRMAASGGLIVAILLTLVARML